MSKAKYTDVLNSREADISVFYKTVVDLKLPMQVFLPDNFNKSEKYKTFQEYRLARHETSSEFLHLVIVGLFLIALSLIFLACYYNVK